MHIKHLALALVAAMAIGGANAQQFFRIGTGGTAGTYYPVGGMIANAVSQPGKIIATAAATNGSVANVNGIAG
ncbi:MAG: TAXI family TRAP transporter solute-binding subunit, partial [Burkholderiaceae bacterium]